MFPQLGAPIGFFFSSATFLALSKWLRPEQFLSFGWRLPFLASGLVHVKDGIGAVDLTVTLDRAGARIVEVCRTMS